MLRINRSSMKLTTSSLLSTRLNQRGPLTSKLAWTTAFSSYAKAVIFAYPHHAQELGNYQNWMQEAFKFQGGRSIKSIIKINEIF